MGLWGCDTLDTGILKSRRALAPKLILRAKGLDGMDASPSSIAASSKPEAEELIDETEPRRNDEIEDAVEGEPVEILTRRFL